MLVHLADLPQPFTRADAAACGVSRHRLATLARHGELTRPATGLYAVAAAWGLLDPRERHAALTRAAVRIVPDAPVSHLSAAVLLGLPTPRGRLGPVTLTDLGGSRTSRAPSFVRLHRADIPGEHVRSLRGVPCTVPTRTLLDCCRSLPVADALAVADSAARRGLLGFTGLAEMRRFQRRWPGVRKADDVLALLDPRREGWFESASAARLQREGVPLGVPQVAVHDGWGELVGRVDVYWPEHGLVGEADGLGKYLGDVDPAMDRRSRAVALRVVAAGRRESRLRDLGLEVVRWDPDEIAHAPWVVASRFHAAVRRSAPGRVTASLRCGCHGGPLTSCPLDREIGAWRARCAAERARSAEWERPQRRTA